MKKMLLIALAAMMALVSCSKDEENLEGRWNAPRFSEEPDDTALVLDFKGSNLTLYIIPWGMRFEGTFSYSSETVTYNIIGGYKALSGVEYDDKGNMNAWEWWAGNLDATTLKLTAGYEWYDMTVDTNPFKEEYQEHKESLASFEFKFTGPDSATSSQIIIPDVVLTRVK